MRTFLGVAGVLFGLMLLVSTAQAGTLLVPQQYATIQAAVDAAVAGDEIVIAAGTYSDPTHPAGGGDPTLCCVVMKSNITLRGAGMGHTIIDAGGVGRGIYFFQTTGSYLYDMTIRNAYSDAFGTGVLLREAQATLQRIEMVDNLYGAIAITEASDLTMLDCIMDSNVGKAGAGLDVEIGCGAYVYNCDITNNQGPTTGGVLLRGDVTMEHCRIDGNAATGGAGVMGGGVGVLNGSPTLRYCTITNNVSGGSGGGIYFTGDTVFGLLENCLIANNRCDGDEGNGGGVGSSSFASPTLRNCVVANNSTTGLWSQGGGGIAVQAGSLVLENCTLYANAVGGTTNTGGNLEIYAIPGMNTVTVTNTIITGATAGAGISCTGGADVVNISCSDVWGNAGGNAVCGTGTNNFSADPLFCDVPGGNFHIDGTSPCAPGNHPGGAGLCGGDLIGAKPEGCDSGVDDAPLQARTRLLGNRPNPFESRTVIAFVLDRDSDVRLEVIDLSGRRVAGLHEGRLPAGEHHVAWDGNREDGTRAASGVYFYRLTAGGESQGMRMLHLD